MSCRQVYLCPTNNVRGKLQGYWKKALILQAIHEGKRALETSDVLFSHLMTEADFPRKTPAAAIDTYAPLPGSVTIVGISSAVDSDHRAAAYIGVDLLARGGRDGAPGRGWTFMWKGCVRLIF